MKKVTKLCFLFTGLLLVSWNLWGQSGSSCTDPLVAVMGTNHADNSNGDQWFVFTATANKSV
ncbi:MAG TPA: hypothetical protein PLD12_05920, partial [Bacteroidales bacterium]|nr:hypothetical protein [Bacteroidales bacterium]